MNRKIWNQFTTAVIGTAIGTTMSIVGSAEATLGSSLTDLVATGQSSTEPTVQSTTENQSTTVDAPNNFAPSQPQGTPKPNVLETPGTQPTPPAVTEQGTSVKPTSHSVPVTDSQPKKAAETRPISNDSAAPAKITQPTRINQTSQQPKPSAQAAKKPQPVQPTKTRAKTRKQGMASWYGPGFNGRRTASGERFNQNSLTAAHRSLPMGTRVKVTNLNNGRSVVVRINDRGPFSGGRIIDLSHGAARLIGVVQSGVAPVLLEVLGR
jgi:rare lipoprotein A